MSKTSAKYDGIGKRERMRRGHEDHWAPDGSGVSPVRHRERRRPPGGRPEAHGHNPGHKRGVRCYPPGPGDYKIRKLTGTIYWAAGAYAALASLFHLYTAGYGVFEPRVQRSMHLLFLVPLVFLAFPFGKRSPQGRPSALDWLWAALSWLASAYLIWDADRLNHRWEGASPVLPMEVALGAMMALLVIEACRRSLSPWMALTISLSLVYLATSQWFPGVFHFKGYPLARMVEFVYLAGDEGMYGFLTGISANILFIYILFAAVMMKAGVGEWVIDVAVRAAGWARGGPAKIAVIGSALFGTISGSTVANVYATGSFTIPLMKRGGYSPKAAAAIEAIAGTGGQIMPPVMGAGVFIMSEVTGISYFDIIKAAAIPAILYYVGLFAVVHFLALRDGLLPVPRSELPSWKPVLRRGYFAVPFVLIVYLLAQGYSPTGAAFYTIVATFVLSFLDRRTWMTPRKCAQALVEAGLSAATIAVALAGSGMIVGVLTRTGAALAFGGVVVQAAQGVLIVAMVLIFLVVSVLGTGIPTTAAYVIAVTVGAAAMGNLGREPPRRAPLRLLLRRPVRSHAARRRHRLRRREHRGVGHVRHRHRGLPPRHRGLPRPVRLRVPSGAAAQGRLGPDSPDDGLRRGLGHRAGLGGGGPCLDADRVGPARGLPRVGGHAGDAPELGTAGGPGRLRGGARVGDVEPAERARSRHRRLSRSSSVASAGGNS